MKRGPYKVAVDRDTPKMTNVMPAVLLTVRPPLSDVSQIFARIAKKA